MFQSASLHAEVTTSPLIFAIADGKVWTNGSCGDGSSGAYNNGTLVARIYGDVRNALTVEVLVPLVPIS